MKKGVFFVFILIILGAIILTNLVSAQFDFDLRQGAQDLIQWIQDIFGPFFEVLLGVSQFDEYFFSRVLLLILLFAIIFIILKKIEIRGREIFADNPIITIVITLIISLFGARYMSEIGLIQGILLPYGVTAVSITIFLPFLIYTFFVHTTVNSSIGRRLAWILFAAVFFGLWYTKYEEMGGYNWIYSVGLIAVGIVFIFDKKLHAYFKLSELGRWERNMRDAEIADLQAEFQRIANVNTHSANSRKREIRRRLRQLHAETPEG